MALRIYETDPDAMPKPRSQFADDVVGRFRSGKSENNKPISLAEWRVTTGDPSLANTLAGMYGGHPEEWETTREDAIEVMTNVSKVDVVIDSAQDISSKLVLWGMGGVRIHECDGVEFLDEDRLGQPCGCPALMAERKRAARSGHGPKPETRVKFRLADDPDLGYFRYQSSSWDLVSVLHETQNALDAIDGPARVTMALELVEFVPKTGEMQGRTVAYRKPVLTVRGKFEA